MNKYFTILLQGQRKYVSAIALLLFGVLALGIYSPGATGALEKQWPDKVQQLTKEIAGAAVERFEQREAALHQCMEKLRTELRQAYTTGPNGSRVLETVLEGCTEECFNISVFDGSGKLTAWRGLIILSEEEYSTRSFPLDEAVFYRSPLHTSLLLADTLSGAGGVNTIVISDVFEKEYQLQHADFQPLSFAKRLEEEYLTDFEIIYDAAADPSRDGRKFSQPLLNTVGSQIAMLVFSKPALSNAASSLRRDISTIQALLLVAVVLLVGMALLKDFFTITRRTLRFLLVAVYIMLFRWAIFELGIPAIFLDGPLTDPLYFSSTFGYGIVRSPLEFFVSVLAAFLIGLYGFLLSWNWYRQSKSDEASLSKFVLILPVALFLILMVFRGFASTLKSVIFDSTIRYFQSPDIFPSPVNLWMNVSSLMLGLGTILLVTALLLLAFKTIKALPRQKQHNFLLAAILFSFLSGVLFIVVQQDPLLTIPLQLIMIAGVYLLLYLLLYRSIQLSFNIIFMTMASSVFSVMLLNHFNTNLEREALKRIALELNRPNDNLLVFLVQQTLTEAAFNEDIIKAFNNPETSPDASAFKLWSRSPFAGENLASSVALYDRRRKLLGYFSMGMDNETATQEGLLLPRPKGLEVERISSEELKGRQVFGGVTPVVVRDILLGYVVSVVEYDKETYGYLDVPGYLAPAQLSFFDAVRSSNINIYSYVDSTMIYMQGRFYPGTEQRRQILDSVYPGNDQAWIPLSFNQEEYTTYVLRSAPVNGERVTAVSLKQDELQWNVFNFFKLFIVHSVIILFLYLIILLSALRKKQDFVYSFRTQLLFWFVIISVLPLLVLAVYNRQNVQQSTEEYIRTGLDERIQFAVNDLNARVASSPSVPVVENCEYVSEATGIRFSFFEGASRIFASFGNLANARLLSPRLPARVHYHLNYLGYSEYFSQSELDGYQFYTLYKRVTIAGNPYYLSVNSAENNIRQPFSTVDFDVFLFGVYAFAVFFILIISALLANRISRPIMKLTGATRSVAHGDLDVQLSGKPVGEIGQLFTGFQHMTSELRKSQQELAELEREAAWKEMARQVAHEIKNPLTPMKLNVQHLRSAFNDKSEQFEKIFNKVVDTLLNQIETLNQIASEFHRFARMPNFTMEQVDLVPHINEIETLFKDERIKLRVDYGIDSAIILADGSHFKRMLINFVRNSMQAGAGTISISLNRENNRAVISIADDGAGIPEEHRVKIFEMNFTTRKSGMGLGLTLAKRFVEAVNGTLTLEDKPDKGAAFLIVIPLAELTASQPQEKT